MSNTTNIPSDRGRPDVDEVLRDYFQAELPHPWPVLHVPGSRNGRPTRSAWSRFSGRLALASAAFMVAPIQATD